MSYRNGGPRAKSNASFGPTEPTLPKSRTATETTREPEIRALGAVFAVLFWMTAIPLITAATSWSILEEDIDEIVFDANVLHAGPTYFSFRRSVSMTSNSGCAGRFVPWPSRSVASD